MKNAIQYRNGVNVYERDARERKAQRLAAVFYRHAVAACVDNDVRRGECRMFKEINEQIQAMVHVAPLEMWQVTAHAHGIAEPSPATVELATHYIIDHICSSSFSGYMELTRALRDS